LVEDEEFGYGCGEFEVKIDVYVEFGSGWRLVMEVFG
jgi:hypothetical protein